MITARFAQKPSIHQRYWRIVPPTNIIGFVRTVFPSLKKCSNGKSFKTLKIKNMKNRATF
jgi:hypothetical protein